MMQAIKILMNEIKNSGKCVEMFARLVSLPGIFRLITVAMTDVMTLMMIIFIYRFMVII